MIGYSQLSICMWRNTVAKRYNLRQNSLNKSIESVTQGHDFTTFDTDPIPSNSPPISRRYWPRVNGCLDGRRWDLWGKALSTFTPKHIPNHANTASWFLFSRNSHGINLLLRTKQPINYNLYSKTLYSAIHSAGCQRLTDKKAKIKIQYKIQSL